MNDKLLILFAILVAGFSAIGCAGPTNTNAVPPVGVTTPTPIATRSTGVANISNSTPRPDEVTEGGQETFDGTAGIVDKKGSGTEASVLTAVRIAAHPNYDRIVFEFSGSSLPGYHVEYIDKPVRSCGSGEVVPLAGDGWLEIRMMPAAAHNDDGEATVKTGEFNPGLSIVKEIKSTCDFEADLTWVAGVSSPNRYRILELKEPTRLVVDIKH